MACEPVVSFILATRNRSDTLLQTLQRIDACGLPSDSYEIWIVDNASTDGTAARVAAARPDVHVLPLAANRGSCAKALAVPRSRGRYVVFLDDDAYPLADSIESMIEHFEADPALGAAGFVVHLAGGGREGCALPHVFVGCGVGLRRAMLDQAGGLDASYFMQAEEYDLSFRLLAAGCKVETFPDLHVLHLKTSQARVGSRTVYYDVRNNLVLAATYLPRPWHREFIRDWLQRYRWLAEQSGADALRAFHRGRRHGLARGRLRRWRWFPGRLQPDVLETLFGFKVIAGGMRALRAEGLRRVHFADLGKNIYPYYLAADHAGLTVTAILDDRFARPGRAYRGIPLLTMADGLAESADAVVISNSAPIHAGATERRLRQVTALPVCRWHGAAEDPPRRFAGGPAAEGVIRGTGYGFRLRPGVS